MERTAFLPGVQPENPDDLPRVDRRTHPALWRSFKLAARGDRIEAARKEAALRAADVLPRQLPEGAEHVELERLTEAFRRRLAREHLDRVREEFARYRSAVCAWERAIEDGGPRSYFVTADGELLEVAPGPVERVDVDGELRAYELADVPAVPTKTLEEMRGALTTRAWHAARARGQRDRFGKVRACGSRLMHVRCGTCGGGTAKENGRPTGEIRAVPEGCGVRRVCKRCDTHGAVKRRARFGRARGRVFIEAHRRQLLRKYRPGGRYSEKMLTLTVPHVTRATVSATLRDETRDDVHVRIEALFRAWPRFARKLGRHLRERFERDVAHHRSFEWTPGADGAGHPHFHVYFFAPFVDVALVREWWAEALEEVGVPVEREEETGRAIVVVDLRMLREFNTNAVRELMKGGRRAALTLSRVELRDGRRFAYVGPGVDAFSYAEGWTLADVDVDDATRAQLYMALEGRRLTQASRGFFEDDEPAACPCCGSGGFLVYFKPAPVEGAPVGYTETSRGPP